MKEETASPKVNSERDDDEIKDNVSKNLNTSVKRMRMITVATKTSPSPVLTPKGSFDIKMRENEKVNKTKLARQV